jgi:hypothetical protein
VGREGKWRMRDGGLVKSAKKQNTPKNKYHLLGLKYKEEEEEALLPMHPPTHPLTYLAILPTG